MAKKYFASLNCIISHSLLQVSLRFLSFPSPSFQGCHGTTCSSKHCWLQQSINSTKNGPGSITLDFLHPFLSFTTIFTWLYNPSSKTLIPEFYSSSIPKYLWCVIHTAYYHCFSKSPRALLSVLRASVCSSFANCKMTEVYHSISTGFTGNHVWTIFFVNKVFVCFLIFYFK